MGQEAGVPEMKSILQGFGLSSVGIIAGYRDRHLFTAPVGSYAANGYGIYDQGGNVWEWCEDRHPTVAGCRVLRGGSWGVFEREFLVSSCRDYDTPNGRGGNYGFRCVVER